MKYIVFYSAVLLFISCKQSVTKLSAKITDSDSMAINWFKGDGSMDTVVAVKIIKDKNAINQLAQLASGHVTESFKCGYDGTLHFFKMNKVIQDIRFRMNDENCRNFSFVLEGRGYNTELTTAAKTLLETLRK